MRGITSAVVERIDLGINLEQFDIDKSIDLNEACCTFLRNRVNQPVHIDEARRWARHGYRLPRTNRVLVLPTVLWHNKYLTMPAWVVAFERKRIELGSN